jgi:DNA-binding transcriptional LysR family regulator
MLCSFMGGVSFGGRLQRPRFRVVVTRRLHRLLFVYTPPEATSELGSNEAIKRSVEMGDGVALVSAALVELETKSGRLAIVRTREPEIVRSFYLTYHRDRRESPLIRAMLDVAREIHPRRK